MATNDTLGTVQRMFAAFRAGDLDRILETVHSDSRWTYVGANPRPTKAELVGHTSVRRFFEDIINRLEINDVRYHRIRGSGRHGRCVW